MMQALSVAELSSRCRDETDRYRRREPYAERFCLELFRRAIVLRDNSCWAAVFSQYAETVGRWLGLQGGTEHEDVLSAFERFWRAVDAAKFARFGSLASVLQYLKLCAHSARLDRARAARAIAAEEPLDETAWSMPAPDDVEAGVTGRLDAAAFWSAVQAVLSDEDERLVIYLSYAVGLSPREIQSRCAPRFAAVTDVYRIKRNALDRLRRAPGIGMRRNT